MTYIIAILILGVLIIIHELGHMLVGRAMGVKVEEFSINIGPKLFSWQPKETLYSVRLIPLGGFCKFLGEEPDEKSLTGPAPGSFYAIGPVKRLMIFLAGPACNVLLGILLCSLFAGFFGMPQYKVVNILPESVAEEAGLRVEDVIYAVEGQEPLLFESPSTLIAKAGDMVNITVVRNGEEKQLSIPKVEIDGQKVVGMQAQAGMQPVGFFGCIQKGFQVTWQMIRMMIEFLGQLIGGLFGGAKPEGELVGPVGFVREMSVGLQSGMPTILLMIAMTTLNLGIANLLPIPGLDGGHCLFVFYELIARKRLNPEREGLVNAIGIALMFGLIILISIKDIFFR
ncbi:MAG: M50 family metallopeptidase [Christensenellales bacterium]